MRFHHADNAVPPPPMPRDHGGWRVAPAPDGRGAPEQSKPSLPHRQRWFWVFFIAVLAVNWLSVLMIGPGAQRRVKVPFSPYFLQQVQAGQVKSISAKADTVQGTFATAVRYPPTGRKRHPPHGSPRRSRASGTGRH